MTENGTRLIAIHRYTGDVYVFSVKDEAVDECVGPVSRREPLTHTLDDFDLDSEDANWMNDHLGKFAIYTQEEYQHDFGETEG